PDLGVAVDDRVRPIRVALRIRPGALRITREQGEVIGLRWVVDTMRIREIRTLMQQAVQVCELWRQIARRQIFLDDDNDMIWRPHGGSRRQGLTGPTTKPRNSPTTKPRSSSPSPPIAKSR